MKPGFSGLSVEVEQLSKLPGVEEASWKLALLRFNHGFTRMKHGFSGLPAEVEQLFQFTGAEGLALRVEGKLENLRYVREVRVLHTGRRW